MCSIELVVGNIVEERVDAIVNAANQSLLGGGGVDGAIHRAAGPGLLEQCRALPADAQGRRCRTGAVRVTGGCRLPARYVIHGVGPVYEPSQAARSEELLRLVHERALAAAAELGCRSMALPAISTGAYRYPLAEAARVALGATQGFLRKRKTSLELVRFVLFTPDHYQAFCRALGSDRWQA